jgi:hypothetical protein
MAAEIPVSTTLEEIDSSISSLTSNLSTYMTEIKGYIEALGCSTENTTKYGLTLTNLTKDLSKIMHSRPITTNYLSFDTNDMPYGVKYYLPSKPTTQKTGTNKTYRNSIDFIIESVDDLAGISLGDIYYNGSYMAGSIPVFYFITNSGYLCYVEYIASTDKVIFNKYKDKGFDVGSLSFSVNGERYYSYKKNWVSIGSDFSTMEDCTYYIENEIKTDLRNEDKKNVKYAQYNTNEFIYTVGTKVNKCVYNEVIYVAGSYSTKGIYYSTDGKTWSKSTITNNLNCDFNCIDNYSPRMIAGSAGYGIYYSYDGITWKKDDGAATATIYCIDFFKDDIFLGDIVVAGSDNGIYYNTNLLSNASWVHADNTSGYIYSIAHITDPGTLTNYYVAGGSNGLYYSADGETWSNKRSGIFYSVCSNNSMFVAGGYITGIVYSTNGTSWTKCDDLDGAIVNNIFYANNIWLASLRSSVYYSSDGKNWTITNVDTCYFESVKYANSIWVAGSNSGGLWYSTDGKSWTNSTTNTSGEFKSVSYSNNMWIASESSNSSGLWYSTDGKTWTQSSQSSGNFCSTCYTNNILRIDQDKSLDLDGLINEYDEYMTEPFGEITNIEYDEDAGCIYIYDVNGNLFYKGGDLTNQGILSNYVSRAYQDDFIPTEYVNNPLYTTNKFNAASIYSTGIINTYDDEFVGNGITHVDAALYYFDFNTIEQHFYLFDSVSRTFMYNKYNKLQRPHSAQYSFIFDSVTLDDVTNNYLYLRNMPASIDIFAYDGYVIVEELSIISRNNPNFNITYRNTNNEFYRPLLINGTSTNCIIMYEKDNDVKYFYSTSTDDNYISTDNDEFVFKINSDILSYLKNNKTDIYDMYITYNENSSYTDYIGGGGIK